MARGKQRSAAERRRAADAAIAEVEGLHHAVHRLEAELAQERAARRTEREADQGAIRSLREQVDAVTTPHLTRVTMDLLETRRKVETYKAGLQDLLNVQHKAVDRAMTIAHESWGIDVVEVQAVFTRAGLIRFAGNRQGEAVISTFVPPLEVRASMLAEKEGRR